MKRVKAVFVLLLVVLMSACSKDDHFSEWIRVAYLTERPVEFSSITEIDQINELNEVIEGLNWQDKQIETTDNSDYAFWLEREGEELRITNYELWFNEKSSSAVIADYVQVKFSTISGVELEQLIQILESGHSTNNKR